MVDLSEQVLIRGFGAWAIMVESGEVRESTEEFQSSKVRLVSSVCVHIFLLLAGSFTEGTFPL